jgi:hypothetical protein
MKLKDLRNVKLNQIKFTKENKRKSKFSKLKFKIIKIYARKHGKHYHIRECNMLNGGEFEKLGYAEIPIKEIKLNKFKIHGNLNYFLFKLCKEVMKKEGESYANYKEFIGELEMCKLEIYRQLVSKYEDKKIKENGNVE